MLVHDIGLRLVKDKTKRIGFEIFVGGGQGRSPFIAKKIKEFLPKEIYLTIWKPFSLFTTCWEEEIIFIKQELKF